MAESDYITESNVKVHELKKEMTILSYTGFSKKYRSIDDTICKFMRHNFKGTKAIVLRRKKKLITSITGLKTGDTILKIYRFPPALKKLIQVNNQLVKALKRRGIVRFDVRKKVVLSNDSKQEIHNAIALVNRLTKRPSLKEERKQESVREINELVQKVTECKDIREKASKSLELAMDRGRKGQMNVDEVKSYINEIIEQASSDAMTAIVSLKQSDQTYSHCIDVGVIFQTSYCSIIEKNGRSSAFDSKSQTMLAAFLHDFGKAQVPKEILESSLRFDRSSQEMDIMKAHPVNGAKLLQGMKMPDSIVNMAYYHHVKRDPTLINSYPPQCKFEQVNFETRLLSIIDIYQALVGRRTYKRSWSPPATMRYLDALAGVEFDEDAFEAYLESMGTYPKGSLVELSDGSMGFVVSVPKGADSSERPLVVVVRNAAGEDLQHKDMLDLVVEKDISITRDLDNYEVFGNKALDVFLNIDVS